MASEADENLANEAMGDETQGNVADNFKQHGEAFIGFLGDIQANVLNSIAAKSVGPDGFMENIQDGYVARLKNLIPPRDNRGSIFVLLDLAFSAAVDWSERWIQGVLAFHLILWLFFILSRKNLGAQIGLFAVILVGTRLSEFINIFLRNRWHMFSRQNYFDEHGLFMGVMWAGPLLILGFSMLVNLLCQAASLLVAVKTEQFKRDIAARKGGDKSKTKRIARDKKTSKQD